MNGTAPPPAAPDPKPLAGIKVLDFGWFMTGPVTTRPLADYGATVVTIESVTRPDSIRLVGPHKDGVFGVNRGGDHAQRRTSHLGITLNLRSEEGKAVARRLVAWADIVFDNFGANVMDRMGFGDEELRAIKPDIIVLTCSGQGETGPHRAVKGGGTHFVALAGLHHLSGPPDEAPPGRQRADRFHLAALQYDAAAGRGRSPAPHRPRRLLRRLAVRSRHHPDGPDHARLLHQRPRAVAAGQPPRRGRAARALPVQRRPLVHDRRLHGRRVAGLRSGDRLAARGRTIPASRPSPGASSTRTNSTATSAPGRAAAVPTRSPACCRTRACPPARWRAARS